MTEDKAMDEVLEFIWSQREEGKSSIKALFEIEEVADSGADRSTLERMRERGLVAIDGDTVTLSASGEELACAAIRRHRLAERLLTEVLAMEEQSIEKNACNFEHTLSAEVAESICTLLGHPPTCPHGLPIPRGRCCELSGREIKPLIAPLSGVEIGGRCRVAFVVSKSHKRLDRLGSLGIVPGSILTVHQKRPAFVIRMGETTLALDPEIIGEIYVRKAD